MTPKKYYKVTCLRCKGSNLAGIAQDTTGNYLIDLNEDHFKNPKEIFIISGRYRPDMKFGWECICRNTSIITNQEVKSEEDIKKIMPRGNQSDVKRLAASLLLQDSKQFTMVEA